MLSLKILRRLERQVRKDHPEMIGFGIGRRNKDGRWKRELAIKLVVSKKRSRRSKTINPFPRKFQLRLGNTKCPVIAWICTDVEEPRLFRPLQFEVSDPNGGAVASCWARWPLANGAWTLGVMTAGHGLWNAGHRLDIAVKSGTSPGRVTMSSDLGRDHMDATLVQFEDREVGEADLLPASPEANVAHPMSLDETIQAIGNSTTDGRDLRMEQWTQDSTDSASALALHLSYTINRSDGSSIVLRNVVEAKGSVDMFVPGRSGAPWASAGADPVPRPLAFTSHGDSQLGLGTHLADALRWLRQAGGLEGLEVAWVPDQWWPA